MEMEESALRHIMDIQTQMLQTITRLQEEQMRNQLFSNTGSPIQDPTASITSQTETLQQPIELTEDGHFQTTKPSYIASPDVKAELPATGMPVNNLAVSDPTQYGTMAAPPLGGGRPNAAAPGNPGAFTQKGLIAGTIEEIRGFDATRQSKEATSAFFAQQARGIQEQAVNIVGGAASGAVAGASFLIPGLLPSLLVGGAAAVGVGGATNAISQGATDALDYQDLLQRESYKFINAFESTDDMGGIGLGLSDRQEISGFLRDLADESFLEDPEMMQILEGASQNSLLKTVSDVNSFKEKFSQIVGAVKEISVTMNASLEEATEFMGEMERRGISTQDAPFVAAQTKVMSSVLGVSTQEGTQLLLDTSDNIVAGTGIEAGNVIQSTAENTFFAQNLADRSKEESPELYNYIKNIGGPGAAGAHFEEMSRNFVRSETGTGNLLGFFGSAFDVNEEGGFEVNQARMSELISGDLSNDELQQRSKEFINTLEPTQVAKLRGTAGELFSASADSAQLSQFLERNIKIVQNASPANIDQETALIEGLELTDDYMDAEFLTSMIGETSEADGSDALKMFRARSLKEMTDANAIADSPGIFKRLKFGIERNIMNPLFGDIGQAVSDKMGTTMEDYQKWVTGIDSRSMVGGQELAAFNAEGLKTVIGELSETVNVQGNVAADLRERAGETNNPFEKMRMEVTAGDIEAGQVDVDSLRELVGRETSGFTGGQLNTYIDSINNGTMDAADMAGLDRRKSDMSYSEQLRANIALDAARGEFEGVGGKINYGVRRAGVGVVGAVEAVGDWGAGLLGFRDDDEPEDADFNFAGRDMSQRSLEKTRDELMDTRKDLGTEVMSLFTTGDFESLNEDQLKELEKAIEAGDESAVGELTDSEEARRLAGEYSHLSELEGEYATGSNNYSNLKRYTKGIATTGTQLGDLLKTAGVYEESEIDDLLGGLIDRGKDVADDLDDMNADEMIEASDQTIAEVGSLFKNMATPKVQILADFMANTDPAAGNQIFEEGTFEDGTGVVNRKGLQEYIMEQMKNQHMTDPGKDEGEGETAEDAKKVTQDHAEALGYYLNTMSNEISMLRDAAEGKQTSNSSSISHR